MSAEAQMSMTHGPHGELGLFYERWNAAFDQRDSAAFVALYAPNARLMPPGAMALVGRDAIRSYIEKTFFAVGIVGSQMQSAIVIDDREYVTDIGTYVLTFEGGLRATGNYMTIFRPSVDGELQACYDIFSASDPL
ncbi:MAG: hypothetical protein QOG79_6605 [Mycobacterium sp.]|nr:hypothetical protein [Mycobacterium sp.]